MSPGTYEVSALLILPYISRPLFNNLSNNLGHFVITLMRIVGFSVVLDMVLQSLVITTPVS